MNANIAETLTTNYHGMIVGVHLSPHLTEAEKDLICLLLSDQLEREVECAFDSANVTLQCNYENTILPPTKRATTSCSPTKQSDLDQLLH
jgi:hypothetical protein